MPYLTKITALFLFVFGFATTINAQSKPTLYLKTTSHVVTVNSNFCVTVSADSFTNIASMQLAIQFNPNLMRFQSMKYNPNTNFSSDNFGLVQTPAGLILLSWIPELEPTSTFPNGTRLFDICFKANTRLTQNTTLQFGAVPILPLEIIRGDGSTVPLITKTGSVRIVKRLSDTLLPQKQSPSVPAPVVIQRIATPNNFDSPNISDIQIYPNPTNKYLNISLDTHSKKDTKILIYNILGSLVKEINIEKGNSTPLSISVENWQKGSYFVRFLQDGEAFEMRKFLVVQ